MDRNLALEAVRVTEAAAIYASRYMGRGDEELANDSAIEAMAKAFSSVSIDGKIIIGETGKPGNILERGREIGNKNGLAVDVALNPLDGKRSCASGGQNTISSIAFGEEGSFFPAPPIYMEKIAVGKGARGVIDITQPPDINIKRIARAKDKYIEDITVCVLDRDRHVELIGYIRDAGARIKLIKDGDISGAIATAMEDSSIDILMGVGGAREGILAAAAIKSLGGDIQARFVYRNDADREMVIAAGEKDLDKIYMINDLVKGKDIMFSATGVTDGELLKGVRFYSGGAETHSIVIRAKTHTFRSIAAMHYFDYKPMY